MSAAGKKPSFYRRNSGRLVMDKAVVQFDRLRAASSQISVSSCMAPNAPAAATAMADPCGSSQDTNAVGNPVIVNQR